MGDKIEPITVMITGAGAPGAPGIIKSLRLNGEREIRIVGVDCNIKESVGLGLVDKVYQVPQANDENFINEIISICNIENVRVVIPLVTRELFKFSEHLDLFATHNVSVIVSELENLKIANNKYKLMDFCRKNDVPVPEFYLVKSIDEFKLAAQKLGYPKRTICFKPPISNGLRGFRIINDTKNKMNSLINEKPTSVFMGYNEFLQIANDSEWFPELLVMEYLPGSEYSVDTLCVKGKCIAVIPRTRDKIKMGISFVGTTIKDDKIISYSKKLVEGLSLNGNIGLQFKRDIDGIPKIIESNPRVQGTIVLCTASGYNMVYNAVKAALGEDIIDYKIKWGTKMIRYWDELYIHKNRSFRI